MKASRGAGEVAQVKAKKTFREALKDVKVQAKMLVEEIEHLHVEEAEIKFGINTVGEIGNIAIGKVSVGVNYEVTLKWKKPSIRNGSNFSIARFNSLRQNPAKPHGDSNFGL